MPSLAARGALKIGNGAGRKSAGRKSAGARPRGRPRQSGSRVERGPWRLRPVRAHVGVRGAGRLPAALPRRAMHARASRPGRRHAPRGQTGRRAAPLRFRQGSRSSSGWCGFSWRCSGCGCSCRPSRTPSRQDRGANRLEAGQLPGKTWRTSGRIMALPVTFLRDAHIVRASQTICPPVGRHAEGAGREAAGITPRGGMPSNDLNQ